MGEAVRDMRQRSKEAVLPVARVKADTYAEDGKPDDLVLRGKHNPIRLTHWSMGQLAAYADAPAGYLRTLPTRLAADCINAGLAKYHGDDTQLLISNNENGPTLRAMTTSYSRLWDEEVIRALRPAVDRGWMVPPGRPAVDDPRARPATPADIVPGQEGFGLSVKVGDMIAPAGCYASDRDMFVLMVNPNRTIDVHSGDSLMRGVIVSNSEVGSGAFKVTAFYLESVCSNHILWYVSNVQTVRVVHRGRNFRNGITGRVLESVRALDHDDTSKERAMLAAARSHVLGKNREEVVAKLAGMKSLGLSQKIIDVSYTVAVRHADDAKASPNTAWGMVHGLTRVSQSTSHTDERMKVDAAAGKLLQLAYTAKS